MNRKPSYLLTLEADQERLQVQERRLLEVPRKRRNARWLLRLLRVREQLVLADLRLRGAWTRATQFDGWTPGPEDAPPEETLEQRLMRLRDRDQERLQRLEAVLRAAEDLLRYSPPPDGTARDRWYALQHAVESLRGARP